MDQVRTYTAQVRFEGGPLDGWRVAVEARTVRWEIRAARLDGDAVLAADGPRVLDADAARLWTTYYLRRYVDGNVIFSVEPPVEARD